VAVPVRNVLGIAAAVLLLAGCGLARQAEQQKLHAEAIASALAEGDACKKRYDAVDRAQAVARAECLIRASQPLRPYEARPDLFDLRQAKLRVVAEKYAAGQISYAEAGLQMAELNSSLASFDQQQALARRSVQAQESAAAAANRSVTCNRIGTSVICD
jgi:hypothetical protein